MTSRLRARTCGTLTRRIRPRPTERPVTEPGDRLPTAEAAAGQDSSDRFGVIVFEGGPWQARRVVLAFDTPLQAAAYAAEHQLPDYLVAPLSFLTPTGVPLT